MTATDDDLVVTVRAADIIAANQVLLEVYRLLHPDGVPIEQTISAGRALLESAVGRLASMPRSAARHERVAWLMPPAATT